MTRYLHLIIFLAGLAIVAWVGVGYVGSNLLALAVILLIGAFYVLGALELRRFNEATATLAAAVADLATPPASLGTWLERLHPTIRNAVRLRVEGERVGLPGPALTPYLAGLLVLLGMLGTFLGMVATLRGTGMALESSTDLEAIRASLAAPVQGLGFAFGTSVAGVAASAMLGLLAALCRRARQDAAQMLDTRIATTLRSYSLAHQREESFKLLQRQADMMPALVDRLQGMAEAMAQQNQALGERLASGQEHFHGRIEAEYRRLAASVEQCLQGAVAESARIAGSTIRPAVDAAMAGIARESATLHDAVSQAVQRQLDTLTTRFDASTKTVADTWNTALAEHRQASQALSGDLHAALGRFAETFEQRSASMVDAVSARLEATAANVSESWESALSRHRHANDALSGELRATFERFAQAAEQRSASLLEGVATRLEAATGAMSQAWETALGEHRRASVALTGDLRGSLDRFSETFAERSATLIEGVSATVGKAHAEWRTEQAERDEARQAAWTQALETMAGTLQHEWRDAGAQAVRRQQEICETLARTAGEVSAQAEAHARSTIAEVERLVQTASEAPRAAAEVIAELRQKLTDSMARDNAMLEERQRLLDTVGNLLDTVNHASTEQRQAVDALVAASADMLERVGARFTEQVGAETGKLESVAAHVTGSAAEVASLGEALGQAVKLFSEANDKLVDHLARIEGALAKAIARSDEQLAYYVAQAKDVIDLSMMSQKQIVEELRQLDVQRAPAGEAP